MMIIIEFYHGYHDNYHSSIQKHSNKTKQRQISSLSSIDLPDVVRLVSQFTSKICLQHAANVALALRTSVNEGFLASSLPMWGMPAACGYLAAPDSNRTVGHLEDAENCKAHVIHIERTYLSLSIHFAHIYLLGGSYKNAIPKGQPDRA